MVVAHDPYPDSTEPNVVKEVVRKSIQVAPPQATRVEMEERRHLRNLSNAQLKFSEKIFPELLGELVILRQNLVQVRLNPAVEPNLHDS